MPSSVSCCSKNSCWLNSSMPCRRASGGAPSHRAVRRGAVFFGWTLIGVSPDGQPSRRALVVGERDLVLIAVGRCARQLQIEGCALTLEAVRPGASTMRFGNPTKEIEAEALPTLGLLVGERSEESRQPIGRQPGALVFHDQLITVVARLPQAKLHHGGAPRVLEHVVEHLVERGLADCGVA